MAKTIYPVKGTDKQVILIKNDGNKCAANCEACALYVGIHNVGCNNDLVSTKCIRTVFGQRMYFHFKEV